MLSRLYVTIIQHIKSKEARNYLATRPEGRFVIVFTPKHGSWLNMIESFFSKMTKQMLKGIRVKSKEELADRIYPYFEEVNKEPVVYHWTYKMDEIGVADVIKVGVKTDGVYIVKLLFDVLVGSESKPLIEV